MYHPPGSSDCKQRSARGPETMGSLMQPQSNSVPPARIGKIGVGWRLTSPVHINPIAEPGMTVRLEAGVVSRLDIKLTYLWSQTSGDNYFFFGATSEHPTVQIPPDAESDQLEFKVLISDGRASVAQTVVLQICSNDFASHVGSPLLQGPQGREVVELGLVSPAPEPAAEAAPASTAPAGEIPAAASFETTSVGSTFLEAVRPEAGPSEAVRPVTAPRCKNPFGYDVPEPETVEPREEEVLEEALKRFEETATERRSGRVAATRRRRGILDRLFGKH